MTLIEFYKALRLFCTSNSSDSVFEYEGCVIPKAFAVQLFEHTSAREQYIRDTELELTMFKDYARLLKKENEEFAFELCEDCSFEDEYNRYAYSKTDDSDDKNMLS